MPATDAQKRAIRKYDKKTYAELRIKPKKTEAEKIKNHAGERGESVTRFLVRAADTQIEIDNKKEK